MTDTKTEITNPNLNLNKGLSDRAFITMNASIFRRDFLENALDPRRDINVEAGYPPKITSIQYKILFDREGVARRSVTIFPEESWKVDPIISEDEEEEESEFEVAWFKFQREKHIYHFLHRIDTLSGIGQYGILYLGFNDGKQPNEKVDRVNDDGKFKEGTDLKLLFLRPFDQSLVQVSEIETNINNPRCGQPNLYNVQFQDLDEKTGTQGKNTSITIHWTRVLHVADLREVSEVFGVPRMQSVYNRMYDLRKIMGGAGEMFWKGGFPGFSFEMNPDVAGDAKFDVESLREEMDAYQNGLQRYLALTGVTAKSLAPQVSDPTPHMDANLKFIAISLGVPFRIFTGSEAAQLASSQDAVAWNTRIMNRQNKYISPLIIRPFIDRMILTGVLPQPQEGYDIGWPDMNTVTEKDKAEIAKLRTDALSKYVQSGVNTIIPTAEFLKLIMQLDPQEVDAILKVAEDIIRDEEDGMDQDEE